MSRVFFPLDDQLCLFERTCSETVAKLAVWLCGQVTPRAAETILDQLGGIAFSDTSVWRRVQTWGAKLQAWEELQRARAAALPQRGTVVPVPQPVSKDMGEAMDGVMIPLREEGFKESKVGCVFDIDRRMVSDPVTGERVEQAQADGFVFSPPKREKRSALAQSISGRDDNSGPNHLGGLDRSTS